MRAIDADALIALVQDSTLLGNGFKQAFCALVNGEPTIEPERKTGKWTLNRDGSATCSECGFVQLNAWDLDSWDNFCHHCGADMRGKEG